MRTRLAPSPTGAIHLGNARTFLVNWALARQQDWQIVLRIDDLDGPRVKQNADQQAIEILSWLGCDWDEGPYYQSQHRSQYRDSLSQLCKLGIIYACRCSRSQIEAAQSAPHAEDHELRYPGTCRPTTPVGVDPAMLDDPELSWRLRVNSHLTTVDDLFAGNQAFHVSHEVGDFAVATKGGAPSYQLAVVVDDHLQRIDQIVRGDDLLSSTARQAIVRDRLELGPPPKYWHLPLVRGEDGRRLAKRHGDSRLQHYRSLGVPAARVRGLLAEWCGCGPRREMSCDEFLAIFNIKHVSPEPIVFRPADDHWLRQ